MKEMVPKAEYDALLALCQAQSRELAALKAELAQLRRMLFGSRGERFRPADEQKELPQLEIYLSDGRVEIDNNLIENTIRPMAIGRKNYLFCGSHDAAERTAMMYSFFATCKTVGLNPWEWLRDVLQRLENHPQKRIAELLPGNWKPSPDNPPL